MGNVKRHVKLAASNDDAGQAAYLDRTLSWSERLRLARAARQETLGDIPERRVLPTQKPWETEADTLDAIEDDPVGLSQLIALNTDNPEAARKTVRARRADLVAQFAAQPSSVSDDSDPDDLNPDSVPDVSSRRPATVVRSMPAAPFATSNAPLGAVKARPITRPLSPGFVAERRSHRRSRLVMTVLLLALVGAGAAVILAAVRYYGNQAPVASTPYRPAVPAVAARGPQNVADASDLNTMSLDRVAQAARFAGPVRRIPTLLSEDLALTDDGNPTRDVRVSQPEMIVGPESPLGQPDVPASLSWGSRATGQSVISVAVPLALALPGADMAPLCSGCDAPGLSGLAGVDVVMHVPDGQAPKHDALRDALDKAGPKSLRQEHAPISTAQGQVRYYDAAQASTAHNIAAIFGAQAVDLTWYRPRPETRRIDILLPEGP